MKRLKNQEGTILVVGMLMLAILSLQGVNATRLVQTELQIVANDAMATKAFYNADAGANVALTDARNLLKPYQSNWDTMPDAITIANSDYNVHNMQFSVAIAPKLDENGQMVLWNEFPVITITSIGRSGSAEANVEIIARRDNLFAKIPSALYAAGGVNASGQAARVNSQYWRGSFDCPNDKDTNDTFDVMTLLGPGNTETAQDFCSSKICGYPARTSDTGPAYPLIETIDKLKKRATIIPADPPNGSVFGSEDNPGIFYCPGDLSTNNITVYGILLVEGNCELAGNIDIKGLSFVKGTSTLKGGGSTEIYGAWLSQGLVTIKGSIEIYYDCRILQNLLNRLETYRMIAWLQL